MSRRYEFDRGLAMGQRLEILAKDPLFSALAAELAPPLGVRTKGSVTDAKGMLLFGAATVLFGSDRSAEAEVAYQWNRLQPALKRAGVAVSADSPTASSWRYYREESKPSMSSGR